MLFFIIIQTFICYYHRLGWYELKDKRDFFFSSARRTSNFKSKSFLTTVKINEVQWEYFVKISQI